MLIWRVQIPFKNCDKSILDKLQNKILELKQHFFAKCAILSADRIIDMEDIVCNYELTHAPRSFFNQDGDSNHVGKENQVSTCNS